jgi:hypothetical protein
MRDWLKRLIKECIEEQKLHTAMKIISTNPPNKTDYEYQVGSIWYYNDKKFIMDKIEADWREYEPTDSA